MLLKITPRMCLISTIEPSCIVIRLLTGDKKKASIDLAHYVAKNFLPEVWAIIVIEAAVAKRPRVIPPCIVAVLFGSVATAVTQVVPAANPLLVAGPTYFLRDPPLRP